MARRAACALGLAVSLCSSLVAGAESALYNRTISSPPGARSELREAVADLKAHLERMTGKPFSPSATVADSGIVATSLQHNWHVPGGTAALEKVSSEGFLVRAEGARRLWIVGTTDAGAAHGLYWYLEKLGCRWLAPSEHWTVIPARDSLAWEGEAVLDPAFLYRGFFATGGFGGSLPLDPRRSVQERWQTWQRRLRYGGPYRLAGHAGEDFVSRNRKELEAHPEYRAEIGGERQPLSAGVKPCYSNPGAVSLYVADRLAKLGEAVRRDPEGPAAYAVSVDPSDGGGHCECADCLRIGTVSDRVFTLANAVAKAVAASYPGRVVNLYAYNEHAAVPSIGLEPNVFVMLVPYGLQRTGLSGDEFIAAWARKVNRLAIYDYWAITDWSNDLPELPPLRLVDARIKRWKECSVEAAMLQSTAAIGAVGPSLYIAAKLLWDPSLDARALLEEFCRDAFGRAAPPMRRMIARWDEGFLPSDHEIALSFRDARDALNLADDPAIERRILDYAKYVHYLRLWHEYRSTKGGSPDRLAAAQRLLEHLWRIYDTSMVHAYRMHVLLVNRYERQTPELAEAWPLNAKAPVWERMPPLSSEETRQLLAEGIDRYEPLEFEVRRYAGEPVPLREIVAAEGKVGSPSLSGLVRFILMPRKGQTEIEFEARCGPRPQPYPGIRIRVERKGREVLAQVIPPDGLARTVTVPTPEPGRYDMTIYDQKAVFQMSVPKNAHIVVAGPMMSADVMKPMYFYVPKGLKTVALYEAGVIPIEVRDSQGRVVPSRGRRMLVFDVPAEEDGAVWSIGKFKSWEPLRLINVPDLLAFTPETILVPEELMERAPKN